MRSAPRLAASISLVALLALAGCGGSDASTKDDGGGGSSAAASAAASVAASSADKGGGGGEAAGDAGGIADDLAPPNANEISRSTAGGLLIVAYETTDSLDTLASYYRDQIPAAGLNVTSDSTAQGGAYWTFESGNFTGTVTIVEGGGTNNTTAVAISVLDTSV